MMRSAYCLGALLNWLHFLFTSPLVDEIPLVEASRPLQERWKFYARVIQKTIRKTCGLQESYQKSIPLRPSLEIGISYDNGDEEYTFFINPLAALLGFRIEF